MNLKIIESILKKNEINPIKNKALTRLILKKLIILNQFIYEEISNYYSNRRKFLLKKNNKKKFPCIIIS